MACFIPLDTQWTVGTQSIHREIMPLRIAVSCATWCHGGIYQSGERRIIGHLYTVAVKVSLCYYIYLSLPQSFPKWYIHHFKVTACKCSWQWLALCCLGLYLVSNCHCVQMAAHPPLSTLANAAMASSGTCHCYPEFPCVPFLISYIQLASPEMSCLAIDLEKERREKETQFITTEKVRSRHWT